MSTDIAFIAADNDAEVILKCLAIVQSMGATTLPATWVAEAAMTEKRLRGQGLVRYDVTSNSDRFQRAISESVCGLVWDDRA